MIRVLDEFESSIGGVPYEWIDWYFEFVEESPNNDQNYKLNKEGIEFVMCSLDENFKWQEKYPQKSTKWHHALDTFKRIHSEILQGKQILTVDEMRLVFDLIVDMPELDYQLEVMNNLKESFEQEMQLIA